LKTNFIVAYKDFTSLPVWQKAFGLLLQIYRLTKKFPDEEKFGMVSDMRRAANSAVHNTAEGFGRYEKKDKSRFYKISRGSCYELISQVLASHALGYLLDPEKEELIPGYKEVITELDLIIKTVESR
jgi:four helix bundle protein